MAVCAEVQRWEDAHFRCRARAGGLSRHRSYQPAARRVRIGYLGGSTDSAALRFTVEPFLQGLRELEWPDGQYLAPIEFRSADSKDQFFPSAARRTVARGPPTVGDGEPSPCTARESGDEVLGRHGSENGLLWSTSAGVGARRHRR